MLTLQDCQFHVTWKKARETTSDLVERFGLEAFSVQELTRLGEIYLKFCQGPEEDIALDRAKQCLESCKARGVEFENEFIESLLSAA